MAKKKTRKRTAAQLRDEVREGYRRLALGRCNDALKLLFYDEPPPPEELAGLDLFNVSDIKRPKGGGMEIRFFDRCEALVRLEALCGEEDGAEGLQAFYQALQASAQEE
ncbi:MAG: hypothetical protein LBG83_06965 [Oscillospiraceae bacterium]|jgi:hypothetical protein|nr:hypothetical protein [Oscillospiraceae bacterium]